METAYLQNPKTPHGIDRILLMANFMPLLGTENHEKELKRFSTWIEKNIKRSLTDQEQLNLLRGICDYVVSDEGSPERMKSMKYIFNTEFLTGKENL